MADSWPEIGLFFQSYRVTDSIPLSEDSGAAPKRDLLVSLTDSSTVELPKTQPTDERQRTRLLLQTFLLAPPLPTEVKAVRREMLQLYEEADEADAKRQIG